MVRIGKNLRRFAWVLATGVSLAFLATGSVTADERPAKQPFKPGPERPLEPGFDPTFTKLPAENDGAANEGAAAPKPRATARPGRVTTPTTPRPPVVRPPVGQPPRPGAGQPAPQPVPNNVYPVPKQNMVNRALAAHAKVKKQWAATKGYSGSAVSLLVTGEVVLRFFSNGVDRPKLPANVDGVRVLTKVVGQFRPYQGTVEPPKPARQKRLPRPVPIGTSALSYIPDVCASGTYGCRLKGTSRGVSRPIYYGLSNSHVFAIEGEGVIGATMIVQPSQGDQFIRDPELEPEDACAVLVDENVIGPLWDFCPIVCDFDPATGIGTPNLIDAAIIISESTIIGATTLPDGYGLPTSNTVQAFLGQRVQKYGRTTGYRTGIVTEIDAVSPVGYDAGPALFVDQIGVTGFPDDDVPLGQPGDSGSLVVDMNRNPVGLLFAGGGFPVSITLCNKIDEVIDYFEISQGVDSLKIDNTTTQVPNGHIGVGTPGAVTEPLLPTIP
jgi:hypothetical protein